MKVCASRWRSKVDAEKAVLEVVEGHVRAAPFVGSKAEAEKRHVADDGNSRILRIQDPAGKAQTFTFDRGWIEVAGVDRADD